MNDPKDFDPIAASLRRQFSPPPMDELAARIAAAALQAETAQTASPSIEQPRSTRRWVFAVAAGFAAAAAVLLALKTGDNSLGEAVAPEPDAPLIARAVTPSQRAGAQLDTFLRSGAKLPGDDGSCAAAPPPPSCAFEGAPELIADSSVVQVGECGGTSNISCADFELPADRALIVQLMPSGVHAIVCIEHPWTDPHPELPSDSGHNIFRRELGDFVIYEVTPLDQPQASAFLRL